MEHQIKIGGTLGVPSTKGVPAKKEHENPHGSLKIVLILLSDNIVLIADCYVSARQATDEEL